ncbi:uncharacterized protein LOC113512110 [Galleria mellonella]|uniref:Uncharacterized protein LOC113512110 n=1 Tax=Galleria mellonella TaxID=7137 RepID=A0A6J1WDQ0_GALME|nr:uncharacterized protein LOC113512110 [Galleria mellonella]
MSGLCFEGEIDSFSIRQQEFLRKVLQNRGYTDNKVIIETVGKAGDNFIANVKRIIVEDKGGSTFKMIAKVAPTNENVRVQVQTQLLFNHEGIMYTEVLPKLLDLQKSAGVPAEDWLKFAECYGVMLDAPDEIIFLEDLQDLNFVMLSRFKSLSNECIKINLRNFAILHSLSMVLKNQQPDVFEDFNSKLPDHFAVFGNTPEYKQYILGIEKDTIEILDGSKYKNAIRGTISQVPEVFAKVSKNETKLKYSVVIHGDGWTNNIMYKLREEVSVQAIMIDYQLAKVSNPVCDILYMIFNCTDYETRRVHYHDWIAYYHLQLEKSLAHFGLKVEYIFSRDQLDADLKRYSKLFLGITTLMSTILIRKSEDAAKLKDAMQTELDGMEEAMAKMHISKLDRESILIFKTRIEGFVNTYRELGYIA